MAFRQHQLRYFVTAAQEGQVTLAAEKLHVAQPALSNAIAQLESELGWQLFDRHSRGITLTNDGEVFLEKALAALAAAEDASLAAEALVRASQGTIAFGYMGLPPAYTNQDLMATFTDTHPNVVVSLRELPFPSPHCRRWPAVAPVPGPPDGLLARRGRRGDLHPTRGRSERRLPAAARRA